MNSRIPYMLNVEPKVVIRLVAGQPTPRTERPRNDLLRLR
jgi:hypothetical protein